MTKVKKITLWYSIFLLALILNQSEAIGYTLKMGDGNNEKSINK